MITRNFRARIMIEGTSVFHEIDIEAINALQAQKIIEAQYKVKKWLTKPYPSPKRK